LAASTLLGDEESGGLFLSSKTFCFLTTCSVAMQVKAIGVLQDCMSNDLAYWPTDISNRAWLTGVHSKLAYYESEFQKLKEASSILELALWKAKIVECRPDKVEGKANNKMDVSDFRLIVASAVELIM
jgi:hypothetical protein